MTKETSGIARRLSSVTLPGQYEKCEYLPAPPLVPAARPRPPSTSALGTSRRDGSATLGADEPSLSGVLRAVVKAEGSQRSRSSPARDSVDARSARSSRVSSSCCSDNSVGGNSESWESYSQYDSSVGSGSTTRRTGESRRRRSSGVSSDHDKRGGSAGGSDLSPASDSKGGTGSTSGAVAKQGGGRRSVEVDRSQKRATINGNTSSDRKEDNKSAAEEKTKRQGRHPSGATDPAPKVNHAINRECGLLKRYLS